MKFVTVASKQDLAGRNIFKHIHEKQPSLSHYLIEKESVQADKIGQEEPLKNYDFIIFASKHESSKGKPSLTVHAPGNWKEARFGGREGKVCKTSGRVLKCLFNSLDKEAKKSGLDSKYDLTLEVTHHGPYLEKPCCFIEIGSSEKEWKDKQAGEVIVRSIKKGINSFDNGDYKDSIPAIGMGGPHYAPSFTKVQLNSDYAVSHIIPQYVFPVNNEMIREAVNKTEEEVEMALLDWKGMKGEERQEVVELLKENNLNHERTTNVDK